MMFGTDNMEDALRLWQRLTYKNATISFCEELGYCALFSSCHNLQLTTPAYYDTKEALHTGFPKVLRTVQLV